MIDLPSELLVLRRHLRLALACAPVVVSIPLACTDGESRSSTQAESDGKIGSLRGRGEPPTTAVPEEPFPLPSCPSGKWCGTKALAEPLRRTDGYAKETPDFEGCPSMIAGNDQVDELDERERYEGLPMHGAMVADIDTEATKAKRSAGEQDSCCYNWMTLCPGGRPLLDEGRPQLASLRTGTRWAASLPELDRRAIARLPVSLRRRIADAWLVDARMEHSSIASFARARRELAAVGAPPELLRGCRRAAVDERRHARVCFGLAAAYGDVSFEPSSLGPLRRRPGGIEQVAIDTFIEGCVGETVAAACMRRAANEARDPALARLLHAIADDEAEHAALAWQTLAWALERSRAPIAAVAAQLRPSAVEHHHDCDRIPAGHGRLDALTRARVRRDTWATIIDPLLASLTTRGA